MNGPTIGPCVVLRLVCARARVGYVREYMDDPKNGLGPPVPKSLAPPLGTLVYSVEENATKNMDRDEILRRDENTADCATHVGLWISTPSQRDIATHATRQSIK